MKIITEKLFVSTRGNPDLINITPYLEKIISRHKLKEGLLTVFVVGSTTAITTFEYEPGLIEDVKAMFEKVIPSNESYQHDLTWNDANGFSHLRAALQGPSLSIPFTEGKLVLGTWQQVVLAEFDIRARERQVAVQIIAE